MRVRIFIFIVIVIIFQLYEQSFAKIKPDDYKHILEKRTKFYPLYYNVLQLSEQQVSEFEYIIEIYNNIYRENLDNKIDKKGLKKIYSSENSDLKKILNKDQKRKYNLIKHLERKDIKSEIHKKNYYKHNPRMSIFGNLPEK